MIELQFENAIDVSLFSDEDRIRVELWGPFFSASNMSPISEENRAVER